MRIYPSSEVLMYDNVKIMYDFFEKNEDFRKYVTRCMATYGKQLTDVLKSPITEEYYRSLIKGGCNERKECNRAEDNGQAC